jgi:hypothetical protein
VKNTTSLTRSARSPGAHRINIGLTLLALIFLIVMVAAAGVRANRSSVAVSPRGETLAVLGVAPGSGDGTKVDDAVNSDAADPAPRTVPAKPR